MQEKIYGLTHAAKLAGVHLTTIKYWCRKYGIGEKVGNQWEIDPKKLDAIIKARDHLHFIKKTHQ
jgi:hypothetical protein